MEKKTARLEIKQVIQDDDVFTFEGYLAVFNNVDYGGDQIEPTAFDDWLDDMKANNEESIPAMWVHGHNEPVGIMPIADMRPDDKGLFIKGILPKKDTFVAGRVIPQMEIGSVKKMSIGYDIVEAVDEKSSEDGRWVRILKKLNLFEGSLVPLAMNDQARITGMKAVVPFGDLPLADRARPWDAASAIGRVKEWAGINEDADLSDPDVQAKYKQAFFWYDRADADLLGSYKLPFADIINGALTAVPRGIFAAAAAVRGARGGVYMPRDDRPGVIRNIEKYYDKMEIESPFSKSFRVDDLTCVDERNLEAILKSGARFSQKTAAAIVSAIKSAGLRDVPEADLRDGAKDAAELLTALDNLNKKLGGN